MYGLCPVIVREENESKSLLSPRHEQIKDILHFSCSVGDSKKWQKLWSPPSPTHPKKSTQQLSESLQDHSKKCHSKRKCKLHHPRLECSSKGWAVHPVKLQTLAKILALYVNFCLTVTWEQTQLTHMKFSSLKSTGPHTLMTDWKIIHNPDPEGNQTFSHDTPCMC